MFKFVEEKLTGAQYSQIQKTKRLSLFLLQHAGALKIARNCLGLAMTRRLFLLHLKLDSEHATTKTIFSLVAVELYH